MAIKTFTTGEVLTASDTNTYLANAGLVYVTQVTIGSGVTSKQVTACFNSTYDNYVVSVSGVTCSNGGGAMYMKMLTGTTPTTSGFYGNTLYLANGGAGGLSNAQMINGAYCEAGSITNTSLNGFTFQVNQPNLAARTFVNFSSTDDYYWRFGAFQHNSTTQFTGLELLPNAGTMTGGTITVYGYRKA